MKSTMTDLTTTMGDDMPKHDLTKQTKALDITSPSYLHSVDGPQIIIYSIMLHENNYNELFCSILNNFCAKNKLGFFD